jgi:hypothetical protein
MARYLIIREVSAGSARLIGVTEETSKSPWEVVNWWASHRAGRAGDDTLTQARIYVADMTTVEVFDLNPQPPVTPVDVVPLDIEAAFADQTPLNVGG